MMLARNRLLVFLLLLCPGGANAGHAEEISTHVKYVAATGIYLDAGSDQGITIGDRAKVLREGEIVAHLEVTYVAASTAVCKLLEGAGIRLGDTALVAIEASEPGKQTESGAVPETNLPAVKPAIQQMATLSKPKTRLSGRIGVRMMIQDDLEATDYDVTEPSVVGRLRAENLFGSYYTLSIRFRSRRVQRSADLSPDTRSEWNNRIYEVSFGYDNPDSPFRYNAGRIVSNRFAGIGTLDGAHAEMGNNGGVAFGLFAGTQPDYRTSRIGTEETKGGIYAAVERGDWSSRRVAGTLALAGRYQGGAVSQEFLYEQVQISSGRTWNLYQSGELEIYRDWRKEATGKSFGLSNLLLNGRWRPLDLVSFDLGYDNRTLVRTYDTRDTPDSLFDDALRQGYRAGVTLNLPYRIRLYTRAGLRVREGESQDTRTLSGGVSQRDLLGTGFMLTLQLNSFENRYSTGLQPSISLARYLFRTVYLNAQVGQSRYDLDSGGQLVYSWSKLGASMSITRSWYASAYGEAYRGDNLTSNRLYLELGYRL